RNDPGRFFGDGVTFKAKLIGILEVGEARGDRMCQEALQDLKMAIRAAGEHKQRITIHVTIDGLRLRDEKTSDSLYHHPVHKISFIAQDMSDSRAFGYIFGSPDSGHRFFGIKTDKAASQVVLAMRDLFQVVFELKKKEIELARQHIQSKTILEHQPVALSVKSSILDSSSPLSTKKSHELLANKTSQKEMSPESVADLVDLEQELSSIQRGITQMERITPGEQTATSNDADPFGDSFTHFITYNLLPPPESSKSRHSKSLKPPEEIKATMSTHPSVSATTTSLTKTLSKDDWLIKSSAIGSVTKSTLDEPIKLPSDDPQTNDLGEIQAAVPEQHIDAFTDLDPLGTGRSRPYIDKKFFFQDLKNPPKKVLKDLTEPEIVFSANFASLASNGGSSEEHLIKDTVANLESSSLLEINNKGSELNSGPVSCGDFVTNFNKTDNFLMSEQNIFKVDLDKHKTDDPIIGNNKALLVTDNDPFSPRMKKFDPFEEDFSKSPLDPFEFNFATKAKPTVLPDTKIVNDDSGKIHIDKRITNFNGPLQVNLPPESYSVYMTHKSVPRYNSDASDSSLARNRPNVFKQNTVDVISSISSKKMKPHLFSQKYTKRDSNSINMRRLQESDSLSENEAPEPPPRPDSSSHAEPPPLPPKKQFSDIVIRPSPLSINRDSCRYDYISQSRRNQQNDQNSPALPLPSRKVTRTESSFPGPGRPAKPVKDEDEYLTPITSKGDLPILLPPPQRASAKNRGRRLQEPTSATTQSTTNIKAEKSIDISLPDITLTQLLTLGIDDLAAKLNVPSNKLSTMNIVELTQYLSAFIETSSQKSIPQPDPPVESETKSDALFKVSFDDSNEATFVAKFDDNFGETNSCFVPNFHNFNEKAAVIQTNHSSVDRYAVFRMMDQELKTQEDDEPQNDTSSFSDNDSNEEPVASADHIPRIDTKITQAISQAKDRYAALRDIILVEDLFDKSTPLPMKKQKDEEVDPAENNGLNDDSDNKATDNENESSPEINISINLDEENDALTDLKPSPILGSRDDLEIDEYMNRAISNLSLDSRDHLSPGISKSPVANSQNASTSPIRIQKQQHLLLQITHPSLSDVSTSPIPTQKSPINMEAIPKSPLSKPSTENINNSSMSRSPIPTNEDVTSLLESMKQVSTTDAVLPSSPQKSKTVSSEIQPIPVVAESWAVFDTITETSVNTTIKSPKQKNELGKETVDSPCSSDEKNEWKTEEEYQRRWPRGHTSSSSRDLSPWDDDGQPERGRRGLHPDRHGFYMRHARRMHSGDDDYEYEEEIEKSNREKRLKSSALRIRDSFDTAEAQKWYRSKNSSWSPQDDDENGEQGGRSFERSCYERSTYGPPYEKRDYRKDYKMYDKKKYYRDQDRPSYDFDDYGDENRKGYYDDYDPRSKSQKDYVEFEPEFKRPSHRNLKDFFYKVDKRSFDRESCESYDSAGRRRKSFGSGDMYGSADSREDFRERYTSAEKIRVIRKGQKQRSIEEYEQDSEGDLVLRRGPGDTRSLQRPALTRPRKSSGSSPWDGEELTPTSSQKSWKRPASASESERRLAENRRSLTHTLPGSDGEKDKRFRKKIRSRGKDGGDGRSNYSTMRYISAHRSSELEYEVANYENEPNYRMPRRKQEALRTSDRRKKDSSFSFDRNMESTHKFSRSSRDVYYANEKEDLDEYVDDGSKNARSIRNEYEYDDYEETPRSMNSGKFTFDDEQGFENGKQFILKQLKKLRFMPEFNILQQLVMRKLRMIIATTNVNKLVPMDENNSVIYGLESQARSLSPQIAEPKEIRFFIATQTLKPTNQLHLVELNENSSSLSAKIFAHPLGEVWKLNSSPHDPRVLVSTYSCQKGSQVVMQSALLRLPESLENTENKEYLSFESTDILDTQAQGNEIKTTEFHPTDSNKLATHHQGNQFVCLYDCGIRSYDIRDPNHCAWQIEDGQFIRDLDCNPNKQCLLVTGGDDGTLKIWDTRSNKEPVFNYLSAFPLDTLETTSEASFSVFCVSSPSTFPPVSKSPTLFLNLSYLKKIAAAN
ncbi:Protein disabled, partial [Pseudolycoriella hygida]